LLPGFYSGGVVYALIKFLEKDGDEPDALGGDKDEPHAQDLLKQQRRERNRRRSQGMDDKED
jgi:hypothetical protein